VRPEGANHLWRKNPPRNLSNSLVADERFCRVTGGLKPRDKGRFGWLSDPAGRNVSDADAGLEVRRGKARSPSGRQADPATFALAGSNRSSRGGGETAEAFDGKCHVGDPASPQAPTLSPIFSNRYVPVLKGCAIAWLRRRNRCRSFLGALSPSDSWIRGTLSTLN
jgi:hypothetical protein